MSWDDVITFSITGKEKQINQLHNDIVQSCYQRDKFYCSEFVILHESTNKNVYEFVMNSNSTPHNYETLKNYSKEFPEVSFYINFGSDGGYVCEGFLQNGVENDTISYEMDEDGNWNFPEDYKPLKDLKFAYEHPEKYKVLVLCKDYYFNKTKHEIIDDISKYIG